MADDRQALLDRALTGDRAARGELLDRFQPYVRKLIRATRQGLPPERAGDSDLMQDAMLVASKAFEKFRGQNVAQFAGWLREVTIRTVGHAVRFHRDTGKRDPSREAAVAELDQLALPDGSSPETRAMGHEQHARLAAALDELPEDMQQVLIGRVFDGLPYRELAQKMGRTEQALRVFYVRALRRLRDLMI
jgi:RNA polymerase sigma-70 factor (ECF subfamily)